MMFNVKYLKCAVRKEVGCKNARPHLLPIKFQYKNFVNKNLIQKRLFFPIPMLDLSFSSLS